MRPISAFFCFLLTLMIFMLSFYLAILYHYEFQAMQMLETVGTIEEISLAYYKHAISTLFSIVSGVFAFCLFCYWLFRIGDPDDCEEET